MKRRGDRERDQATGREQAARRRDALITDLRAREAAARVAAEVDADDRPEEDDGRGDDP